MQSIYGRFEEKLYISVSALDGILWKIILYSENVLPSVWEGELYPCIAIVKSHVYNESIRLGLSIK